MKKGWYGLIALLVAAPAFAGAVVAETIYHDGWIDLNKNGQKDRYEDPAVAIEQRIDDLLERMTLEEKTCQLATLYGYRRVLMDPLPTEEWEDEIWKDGIGNIDEHCNGTHGRGLEFATPPSRHAEVINTVQRWFIEQTRLGIPVDFTNEGIRGLCNKDATGFPAQIGVGCSFDKDLVSRIGHVTGREAKALGFSCVYSPILDLGRDPRWGRVVETYTEDPYLASVLGVEQVKGLQAEGVGSSPKHFAVYSVPKGGRDNDARTDPHATLHAVEEILLAPFRAAIMKGGALGVMASYNDYDSTPIVASRDFMIRRLREEYGFRGYVVSDSGAVDLLEDRHGVATDYKDATRMAYLSGLNVTTNFDPPSKFIEPLRELAQEGGLPMEVIDSRVRDVLRVKYLHGLFDQPYVTDPAAADEIVRAPEHLETALQASRESLVLLKNEGGTLPLGKDLDSVLVTGPNAVDVSHSFSRYGPHEPEVISMLDGIRQLVGDQIEVKYVQGCDFVDENWPQSEILPEPLTEQQRAGIAEAVEMARQVDVVIACVGETASMVGESFSRTSLDLPALQRELLKALKGTGKPVVAVLINGRPLSINWMDRHVPAILEAWFPGEFGGVAVAEALFGDVNPGGKLSVTFPKTVGQIPFNFPTKPAAQSAQTVDRFRRKGTGTRIDGALYPFGHGLSYTTFAYDNLRITPSQQTPEGTVAVTVELRNTGDRVGDEVVQLYLRDQVSSSITYEKVLRGFERVTLNPGETRTVRFMLEPEDLQLLNPDMQWVVEPGEFDIMVGSSSEDIRQEGELTIVQAE